MRIAALLRKLVEAVLAMLMFGMVLMVFGNVVLRYFFNSNLVVSEELSRFFFIWLTFIGAVLAAYEGTHLGIDNLVRRLSRRGKVACMAACELMILLCCVMIFHGTVRQHEVNATSMAPVTGMAMSWIFGVAYFTSALIGLHAVHRLWRIASGRITDAELIGVRAEEDMPSAHPGRTAADAETSPTQRVQSLDSP
jgi:TRAP-type C4-dicarboxylate transport system permease small subunit